MKRLLLSLVAALVAACSAPPDLQDGSGADVLAADAQDVGAIDVPTDVATADTASDAVRDVSSDVRSDALTSMCGPTWQPTACHDCGGSSNGTTCNQPCMSCDDGHLYRSECDGPSATCHCFIDNVEACTCTIHVPIGATGCEPEAFGGSNCCWNVG